MTLTFVGGDLLHSSVVSSQIESVVWNQGSDNIIDASNLASSDPLKTITINSLTPAAGNLVLKIKLRAPDGAVSAEIQTTITVASGRSLQVHYLWDNDYNQDGVMDSSQVINWTTAHKTTYNLGSHTYAWNGIDRVANGHHGIIHSYPDLNNWAETIYTVPGTGVTYKLNRFTQGADQRVVSNVYLQYAGQHHNYDPVTESNYNAGLSDNPGSWVIDMNETTGGLNYMIMFRCENDNLQTRDWMFFRTGNETRIEHYNGSILCGNNTSFTDAELPMVNGYIYMFEFRLPLTYDVNSLNHNMYKILFKDTNSQYVQVRYYNPGTDTWTKTSIKSGVLQSFSGYAYPQIEETVALGTINGYFSYYNPEVTMFSHVITDATWKDDREGVYNELATRYLNHGPKHT